MTTNESELEAQLAQFSGSEQWYRALGSLRFTEGVKHLADEAQAYWLIDAIASYQPELARRVSGFSGEPGIEFQVWFLRVDRDRGSAVLTCQEDWDEDEPKAFPEIVRQEIPYTDFPLGLIRLYCEHQTLMLPNER